MAVRVAESYVTVAGITTPEASSRTTVEDVMVAGFMFSLKGTRMLDPVLTPVAPLTGYVEDDWTVGGTMSAAVVNAHTKFDVRRFPAMSRTPPVPPLIVAVYAAP
jgi:hypothetical protein